MSLDQCLPDSSNQAAILTVSSTEDGIECRRWTALLLRMYLRWAERSGFRTETGCLPLDRPDCRTGALIIQGPRALHLLQGETGRHTLQRIPEKGYRRGRVITVAVVEVIPEADGSDDLDVPAEEIMINTCVTYRVSPALRRVDSRSIIRMVHLPSGTDVNCFQGSLPEQRQLALRVLRARILAARKGRLELEKEIRKYIFDPAPGVKDVQTGFQTQDVQGVLDGKIDCFLLR